jgi:hypothetical protein
MQRLRLLLIAAPLLVAAAAPPPNCPFSATPFNRQALFHRLSASAEAIAPSATTNRHRAVRPVAPLPQANFIDTFVSSRLQKSGVSPAGIAGDEEFLRRVSLDLTGRIPTAAAVQAFVADPTPGKRANKIDELLASPAFCDRWTMWFGDLVQNVQTAKVINLFYPGRNAYHDWIYASICGGKPYDQMVRELVAAQGDATTSGPPNFIARQQINGPFQDLYDNLASTSGDQFLGVRLLCISCHDGRGHLEGVNSYLRNKSRYDFWRTAAFFSRLDLTWTGYNDPLDSRSRFIKYEFGDNLTGSYRLNTTDGNKSPRKPADGQPDFVTPAFILTGEAPGAGEPYRQAFGRMLTSNRQFARATVNYLWKEMFGLGLVEPADGFDLSQLGTQPSNPELLEALTDDFIANGYSLRATLRTMAMSSTYQLSTRYTPGGWNEAWVPLFARHYPHRLTAEMLYDAVAAATGVETLIDVRGTSSVAHAMQLPDPLEPGPFTRVGIFLNNFGRGNRDDALRTNDGSILQALAVMNDTIVTSRILRSTSGSAVARVLASTSDPGAIVDQIYLDTLSRRPNAAERQVAINSLLEGDLGDSAEDLQFALINSLEFLFD